MDTIIFLFCNMFKQAFKGNFHEAFDAWCWLCTHVWLSLRGRVTRLPGCEYCADMTIVYACVCGRKDKPDKEENK